MPNSRQWALLFWVVVFMAWALSRRDVRTSIVEILRVARSPKLLVPFGGMLVWITLEFADLVDRLRAAGEVVTTHDGDRLATPRVWRFPLF